MRSFDLSDSHQANHEPLDIRPKTLINRIGFLIHTPELLFHFGPVMELLGPDQVEILIYAYKEEDYICLENAVKSLPYRYRFAPNLLQQRLAYRLLISNHYIGLGQARKQLHSKVNPPGFYVIRALGYANLRFMYDLGADLWNFADWNRLYDAFLCFGHWHEQRLACFSGKKMFMGYPRYDAFFNQPLDREAWLRQLNCSPDKPVILWFSTLGSYHGVIPFFAEKLSKLSSDYNLVLKPHPFSWQQEPTYLQALQGLDFTHVISEPTDNVPLLQLADYVLADYGALVFDALYTDQRLLLLDHPHYPGTASKDPLTSDTEAWLRHFIKHVSVEEADKIPDLLCDPRLWQAQSNLREQLRPLFFAPYTGSSTAVAADQIMKMYQSLAS